MQRASMGISQSQAAALTACRFPVLRFCHPAKVSLPQRSHRTTPFTARYRHEFMQGPRLLAAELRATGVAG